MMRGNVAIAMRPDKPRSLKLPTRALIVVTRRLALVAVGEAQAVLSVKTSLGGHLACRASMIAAAMVFLLPIAAVGGDADWIVDAKSGCAAWNPSPSSNETITWSGACANGRANGSGVLHWFKRGKPSGRIQGSFRDGRLSGPGIAEFASGNTYRGEFRDSKIYGRGVFSFANGDRYEGELQDGLFNGLGIYMYSDGTWYEGEFVDDDFHGRGVWGDASGERYEGDFQYGLQNGFGTYTWPDGSRYMGAWRDGRMTGKGTSHHPDGRIESGIFADGKLVE